MKIKKGEIFGFIGPNGAGKTTTIDILATFLKPTRGDAYINGYSVVSQAKKVREIIGYMPDFFGLYENLRVWEYLDFFAKAYKIDSARKRIKEVLETVGLEGKEKIFIRELSRGMKQKLCIAKTLIHEPDYLILDEPASGLDPKSRIELLNLLKDLRREGKTIFVSSHILREIEDVCTNIGIINKGKLVAHGKKEKIYKMIYKKRRYLVKFISGKENILEVLSNFGKVDDIEVKEDLIEFCFSGERKEIPSLLKELVKAGEIVEFKEVLKPSLEDVFIKIVRGG